MSVKKYDYDERCNALYPGKTPINTPWHCSLKKGHDGQHMAYRGHEIDGKPKYVWLNEKDQPLELNDQGRCEEMFEKNFMAYRCYLPKGHLGNHITYDSFKIITWPNEKEIEVKEDTSTIDSVCAVCGFRNGQHQIFTNFCPVRFNIGKYQLTSFVDSGEKRTIDEECHMFIINDLALNLRPKQTTYPEMDQGKVCDRLGLKKIGPMPFAVSNSEIPNLCGSFPEIPDNSNQRGIIDSCDGYEPLRHVLDRAIEDAKSGKGTRHQRGGKSFHEQDICEIQRAVGTGFGLGQAIKKINEIVNIPETERKVNELLHCINYIAATIIVMEEQPKK